MGGGACVQTDRLSLEKFPVALNLLGGKTRRLYTAAVEDQLFSRLLCELWVRFLSR